MTNRVATVTDGDKSLPTGAIKGSLNCLPLLFR
jgi:hypothetical protein